MAGANPALVIRVAANIAELKANLLEGKLQIETTTAAMTKLASSLDGSKLEQRAHNIVAAINQVGGATKLTDAEAQRHLTTLDAWIQKAQRMGKDIPPQILATRDALQQVGVEATKASTATSSWTSTFGATLAGFLSAQSIVGAATAAWNLFSSAVNAAKDFIVNAVTSTAQLGDELFTLSNKSGIAVEKLAEFRYIGEQTGTSLDTITNSVFKLQAGLGEGGGKIAHALDAIGLSISALKNMNPDEAFTLVLERMREIPSESERAAVGTALFSRGFRDMAQLVREDVSSMRDRFAELGGGMTTELAIVSDAFGDAQSDWNKLVENITSSIGASLLPAATAFVQVMTDTVISVLRDSSVSSGDFQKAIADSFSSVLNLTGLLLQGLGSLALGFATMVQGIANDLGGLIMMGAGLGKWMADIASSMPPANAAAAALGINLKELSFKFTELGAVGATVVTVGATSAASLGQLGTTVSAVGDQIKNKGSDALQELTTQLAASAAASKTTGDAYSYGGEKAAEHAKAVAKLRDELTGDGAVKALNDMAEALKGTNIATGVSKDGIDAFSKAFDAATRSAKPLTVEAKKLIVEMAKLGRLDVDGVKGWKGFFDGMHFRIAPFKDDLQGLVLLFDQLNRRAQITTGIRLPEYFTKLGGTLPTPKLEDLVSQLGITETQLKKLVDHIKLVEEETAKGGWQKFGESFARIGAIFDGINDKFAQVFSVISRGFEVITAAADTFATRGQEMGTKVAAGFTMAAQVVSQFAGASLAGAVAVGALQGAATGAMVAGMLAGAQFTAWLGPLAAIGAAIGGLVGYFRAASAEAARLRQANVDASKSVDELRKSLLQQYGDLHAIWDIGRVIGVDLAQAWGDQSQAGLEHFTELLEQFQETQEALFESIERNGGLAEQQLLDLLAAYERTRGASLAGSDLADQAAAFILAQLNAAGAGISAMLLGMQASADAVAQGIAKAAGATDEALKSIRGTFLQTQQQARGLGAAVVGVFAEMISRGVAFKDALKAVQPAIDTMRQQLQATGLDGGAAFNGLAIMAAIAGDAITGPLVTAMTEARNALTGLHNSGILNQEMFTGIVMTATQAHDAIVAAGGDGVAALQMMQPTLQTIWQLQQDFGYEVDASTQGLINQAVQAGMVGERFRDAADRMARSMERVVEVLELIARGMGFDLPNAAKEAGDSGEDATGLIMVGAEDAERRVLDLSDGFHLLADEIDTIDPQPLYDLAAAAEAASDAVNKLNFGSSPGGLKEIPLLLDEAERHARSFERTMNIVAGAVYGAAETMSGEIEKVAKELGLLYAFGAGFDDFLVGDEKRLKEAGLYEFWKDWRSQFLDTHRGGGDGGDDGPPRIDGFGDGRGGGGWSGGDSGRIAGGGRMVIPPKGIDINLYVHADRQGILRAVVKDTPANVRLYTR